VPAVLFCPSISDSIYNIQSSYYTVGALRISYGFLTYPADYSDLRILSKSWADRNHACFRPCSGGIRAPIETSIPSSLEDAYPKLLIWLLVFKVGTLNMSLKKFAKLLKISFVLSQI
jgi:hypothetical protein